MPIGGGNTFNFGFKAIIVLALIALAVLSFQAFTNDHPALGWFFVGIGVAVVCLWVLLAGGRSVVVIVVLCICVVTAVVAYFCGVPQQWKELTGQTELGTQQRQEIPPKYFVLMNGKNQP